MKENRCINYGKYPFCKQCKYTGEKCEDYEELERE